MTEEFPFCECGCGQRVTKPENRFIWGHQNRGKNNSMYGITQSPEILAKKGKTISKVRRLKKDPLPNGWEIKDGPITTNKNCSCYLGIYIAEQILSKVFKNVKVMGIGNCGYDFICGDGYKIDVKSAATGDKSGHWIFYTSKNKIPDYFIFIAFDNRDDLNPTHLWIVPSNIVNQLGAITISKKNLHKWAKYEQPLDKVIKCCNEMKQPKAL